MFAIVYKHNNNTLIVCCGPAWRPFGRFTFDMVSLFNTEKEAQTLIDSRYEDWGEQDTSKFYIIPVNEVKRRMIEVALL